MTLWHFFHIYADGQWQEPVSEHLGALQQSGLADNLDGIYYGLVGAPKARDTVKQVMPGTCVAEADKGWEQVTLDSLREFSKDHNGLVLYGHTKGAWSQSALAAQWRRSMILDNVWRWREAVAGLQDRDVAGSHWLKSNDKEHEDHKYFFGGNFWWAHLSYIRSLPPLKWEHRHQAEGWIGLGNPKPFQLREGYSHSGNFHRGKLPFDAVEI